MNFRLFPKNLPGPRRFRAYTNSVVDVFNTGIDNAFEDSKAVLPELIELARIPKELRKDPTDDYEARVKKLLAEREQRMKALQAMDDRERSA